MPMSQMNAAHIWFLVLSWINLLAPTGYWALWVFFKIDPIANIIPFVTDAMSLVTSVTSIVTLISTADANGDGVEDADDATYVSD